nr:hypothetical protein Iba_chr14aCG24420 [Ipomoea batatas]GMD92822.1 hypothetical protein Iba_scaffold407405CG0020 [Ipomoea batatas]
MPIWKSKKFKRALVSLWNPNARNWMSCVARRNGHCQRIGSFHMLMGLLQM